MALLYEGEIIVKEYLRVMKKVTLEVRDGSGVVQCNRCLPYGWICKRSADGRVREFAGGARDNHGAIEGCDDRARLTGIGTEVECGDFTELK